jgi:ribonuclease BN (tRNA processing enzyme)
MKVELLPSTLGSRDAPSQFLTSILIGDRICLDAGSVGFHPDLELQRRVRHVFISHSHLDHTASLPLLLDNVFGAHPEGVHVHASEAAEQALREDIFNNRTWPDFLRISDEGPQRLITLHRLVPGKTVEVEGVRVTPVTVAHVVPTVGFIVDDGRSAIAVATDTGPSDALWEAANRLPHLKAVLLEVSFPEQLGWLATVAQHLTPRLFAAEVAKLRGDPAIYALHLKATHRVEIIEELAREGIDRLQILEAGRVYDF